jgi:hypothetical protein
VASATRGTAIIILAPTATQSQIVLDKAKDEYRLFKPMLPGKIEIYNEIIHY